MRPTKSPAVIRRQPPARPRRRGASPRPPGCPPTRQAALTVALLGGPLPADRSLPDRGRTRPSVLGRLALHALASAIARLPRGEQQPRSSGSTAARGRRPGTCPVTFACLQHQRFLREGCAQAHPGGPAAWRLIASPPPAPCVLPSAGPAPASRKNRQGTALPAASAWTSPARTAFPAQPGNPGRPGTPPRPAPPSAPRRGRRPAPSPTCEVISAPCLCRSWPLGRDSRGLPPGRRGQRSTSAG